MSAYAADRAALLNLPLPGLVSLTRMRACTRVSSLRNSTAYDDVAAAMWTLADLPTLEEGATDAEDEVAASDAAAAVAELRSLSGVAADVVDVDASDSDEEQIGHAARTSRTVAAVPSSNNPSVLTATEEVPASTLVFPTSHTLSIRDAVVLSYGESLSCAPALYNEMATGTRDLISVAIDSNRLYLRRGGHQAVSPTAVPSTRLRRHAPRLKSLHLTYGQMMAENGEDAQLSLSQRGRRDGTFFSHSSLTENSASRFTESSGQTLLPLYTTRWEHVSSTHLPEAQNQLLRVRPHGGAQAVLHFSGGPLGNSARCCSDFVALSSTAISLVQAREYGTELVPLHHVPLDGDVVVNATCMDDWGEGCSVVGFSDGTLRVVDWRLPSTSNSLASAAVLATRVPQPRWLGTSRRGSLVFSSVAGVLSCCALQDSFRVVCGLGDASGTVVVADLRKPDAPLDRKRGRRSGVEKATEALFSDAGGQSPTGRAVTDISRDPQHFGRVGLVDVVGQTVVTHISVLEGTAEPPTRCKRYTFVDGKEEEEVGYPPRTPSPSPSGSRPPASVAATTAPAATQPRQPFPPLSSLWQSVVRAHPTGMPLPTVANPLQEAFTIRQPPPPSRQSHPRCVFSVTGEHFIHAEFNEIGKAVTVRRVDGGTASHKGVRRGATQLYLPPTPAEHAALSSSSFVAVSSVDNVVCLDTDRGDTLTLALR